MTPDSAFNPFLYASVGDDADGMSLSLLSAFARQDVDPWEQAAALSRLPAESAHVQLVAMLGALPRHASLADRNVIAGRLIPLLPKEPAHGPAAGRDILRVMGGEGSPEGRELRLAMVYLALMILGLWLFSGGSAAPPQPGGAEHPVPSRATQAMSSAQREQP
jgi:hypothetical protein